MKNMRVPTRPAPSVEELRTKPGQQSFFGRFQSKQQQQQPPKKKPPPRPPPPNFSKIQKSTSAWNLVDNNNQCLIDWSPANSPITQKRTFTPSGAGSISSSFSSSTSSLASSKKSFEYDAAFNISPWTVNNAQSSATNSSSNTIRVPTIIRPQVAKKPNLRNSSFFGSGSNSASRDVSPVPSRALYSLPSIDGAVVTLSPPMPNLPPPPSPPKQAADDLELAPFGIALYDYQTGHPDDLAFEVNDIIYITERVNDDWFRGRVDILEGMFPVTFVDVQVPLPDGPKMSTTSAATARSRRPATVLYDYSPNAAGYLNVTAGCVVNVLHRVDADWWMGELNGIEGQFPANYVDKLPEGV